MKALLAALPESLAIASVAFPVLLGFAVFCHFFPLIPHPKQADQSAELHSLQSSLDHLRSLNWLLSRQLEREKQSEQMKP